MAQIINYKTKVYLYFKQAESDRESGASSPEGGTARAQLAEPRTPSPRSRTPQHQQPHMNGSSEFVLNTLFIILKLTDLLNCDDVPTPSQFWPRRSDSTETRRVLSVPSLSRSVICLSVWDGYPKRPETNQAQDLRLRLCSIDAR